jgi:hypothetical protein
MWSGTNITAGNYLQLLGKVSSVSKSWLGTFTKAKPIPLTHEILEQFEIKTEWFSNIQVAQLEDGYWKYKIGELRIGLDLDLVSFQGVILKGVKLKHVHELQNLYYALHGYNELEIKL